MYDLPKGTTLDFLRDREVELVCFGPYTVTLHFGNEISLQIEGAFDHSIAGNKLHVKSFPLDNSQLMRLLMQRVEKVAAKADGTLTLDFSNGDRLLIHGNVGPYESYHVGYPGGLVVV